MMGVASMISDPAALAAARAWIGTPYVGGQATRSRGCDCVGLVRGVLADLTGHPAPPPPPFRSDWANGGRLLVEAARRHLVPIEKGQAGPGCVVVLRVGGAREAHCGILADDGRFIHALEKVGVVEVPFEAYHPDMAYAARFPHRAAPSTP